MGLGSFVRSWCGICLDGDCGEFSVKGNSYKHKRIRLSMKKSAVLDFGAGFSYPFGKARRMWNALWLLLPIFGWFALGGYSVRITKEWAGGKFKQLPEMKFLSDMKLGFMMFLKALPFFIAYVIVNSILGLIPGAGFFANLFLSLFIVPVLSINFMVKQTIDSYFEFGVLDKVFANFGDYSVALLKSVALGIIYLVLIIVLVGIPGSMFTKNIYIADFYRRQVK